MRGLIFSIFLATPTIAQATCAPYDEFRAAAVELGASLVVEGLQGNGDLMQIFTNEKGEWFVLLISPQGGACMVSAGTHIAFPPQGERM